MSAKKDTKYETKRWSDPVITGLAKQVGELKQSVDLNTKFINEKMADFKTHCQNTCQVITTEISKIHSKAEKSEVDKIRNNVAKHNTFWAILIFFLSIISVALVNLYIQMIAQKAIGG